MAVSPSVTLHRVVVHLVAERYRHADHASVVREELIDGTVGGAAATNMARGDPVWWENDRKRRKQAEREAGPA